MAEYDNVEMLGDDESLFTPAPTMRQKALAAIVRGTPALATPSGGVQLPPAAPVAAPTPAAAAAPAGPAVGTSAYTMQQIADRMFQRPDPAEYIAHAKERGDQSNRRLMLGLTLGAMGGKGFSPFGHELTQQALKDSGDYQIPGGWGSVGPEGKVLWNTAKQQEADLARLTTIYGVQERTEATRAAAQARLDALRSAAADRASAAADRTAASGDQNRSREEDRMQKIYEAQVKNYREELNATSKVSQMAPTMIGRRPNAIEQQTLMVLLNKFLDPGSVVREGEFDRVAKAQGYVDRASNLMNYISRGEPLSDKLIANIVEMAKFYENASKSKLQTIGDEWTRKSKARGLDPANVIIDPYYVPADRRAAAGAASPGRGTADSPIRVLPRAAAAAGGKDVIEVPY